MIKRMKKKKVKEQDENILWSKFKKIKKVHIVSNGIFTICRAVYLDGVDEYYDWSKKENRELVYNTVTDDVEVIVDDNVTKGWKCDE